jgi:TraX protein
LASHSLAAPAAARPVTTTDAWKLFAITVVLIDHYGLYFDPADPWWRLFGRLAAPVFFFFIGFARTRTVPWTWIVLGAVITAVDHWTSGGRNLMANILINFALLRLALPAIEAHVIPYPWRLAVTVAVSAALIPVLDPYLEYGGGGWLWALFGLSHRLHLEQCDGASLLQRNLLAVAAGLAYVVRERWRFSFDPLQSALLVLLVTVLILALMHFRREALGWQPPPPLRDVFSFAGRRTLEIYAVTLIAMQITAFTLDAASSEGEKTGEGAGDGR